MKRVCPEFFIARYGLQKNVKQPLRYGVRTQPLLCAVSNIKFKKIQWVGEKWFKSWCHSERSLYKNLIWSLTDFLVLFTEYSRPETRMSLGKLSSQVSASIGWLALNLPVESHCTDWVFCQLRERRTKYFSNVSNVLTQLCWPLDVYRPRQGDKLLEEKAQRRIINRWLSLIRNRCL